MWYAEWHGKGPEFVILLMAVVKVTENGNQVVTGLAWPPLRRRSGMVSGKYRK